MSYKLSDGLATLSAKSKSVEDSIAQAKTESKEKLDAQIAEAKSYVEKIKNEFISKASAAKDTVDGKISSAKTSLQEKVDQLKVQATSKAADIKEKVAVKKQEINLKEAEWRYQNAVDNVQNCIDWAVIALAEVEESALEVLDAKANLDSVKSPGA
jgi:hypothetical protein